MVFIFWQRGRGAEGKRRRRRAPGKRAGGRGGLACSAQLRGKRLRRTRAVGMEEQPGGGDGFSRGASGLADPLARGRRGHATVTLTMGFLFAATP